jgi:probable aminopeptidase NPEPL1
VYQCPIDLSLKGAATASLPPMVISLVGKPLHSHLTRGFCGRWNFSLGIVLFLSSSRTAQSFTSASFPSSGHSLTTSLLQRSIISSFLIFPTSVTASSSSPFCFSSQRSQLNMMMSTTISFAFSTEDEKDVSTTMVIGKKDVLKELFSNGKTLGLESDTAETVMESIDGPTGAASTFVGKTKVVIGIVPDKVSRNNHPWSVHAITEMVATNLPQGRTSRVIMVGDDAVTYQGPLTCAVAKGFPMYSKKTTSGSRKGDDESEKNSRRIHLQFWDSQGNELVCQPDATKAALAAVEGIQLAARLSDMTPEELTTDAYSKECQKVANQLNDVTFREIVGEELNLQGYGGIYGVGKAATCPPRLVIMEYTPGTAAPDSKTICLVGKAIVYDTGGLALKPREGMAGMKYDMAGSAGLLGGFASAVKSGYPHKLCLLLCMAENAIGSKAFRHDDILTMYSGKTVEINNSDAEGRLVLGDGVAHATKNIPNLDLVIDMATLTGAQMVATGQKHAGILANKQELEVKAVTAGLRSGDLAYPLLYAPELLKKEFNSKVADMKNSVKDRSNAQSSCAGHFIESHLEEDYGGGWLHVDMAGPATNNERGTGYGVGFVMSFLGMPGF